MRKILKIWQVWAFDEWSLHNGWGYAEIQKRNGVMVYDAPIFADIQINRFQLHTDYVIVKHRNNLETLITPMVPFLRIIHASYLCKIL